MSVRIDLDSLLAAGDGGAVPFAIRADEGGDLHDLTDAVRRAIDAANAAARGRFPDDPTWGAEPDLAGEEIHSELADGPRTEPELRAWFADLAAALGDRELVVHAVTLDDRLPDLDPWIGLDPAATAFVSLSAPWEGRLRTTTAETIDAIADGLSSWCRLAGATTIVQRGTSSFVVDHRDAARELRAGPALDYMYGLWEIVNAPRRARLVDFRFQAKAVLQVVDETSTAVERLPDLLAGLRVVAPYVDYAWVRRATPLIPNERDISVVLGRQPTAMEELASNRRVLPLLAEYVVDAYVAQVLTTRHLERAGSLASFEIEDLGGDRHLVVARDPEPWLKELVPIPDVLERARGELGAALLTADIVYAQPGWHRTALSEESS